MAGQRRPRVARAILFAGLAFGLAICAMAPSLSGAQVQSSLNLNGRTFSLSGIELDRLLDLSRVVHDPNRPAQDHALAAAEAVVSSSDARFVLALYQLEIGRQRQDDALRVRALDVLIAQPGVPPAQLASYLGVRGDIAFRAHDLATASAMWGRLAQLQPGDPQAQVNLAQVRDAEGDHQGAADLLGRAIAARGAGPPKPPEIWYRQWLSIAHNAHLTEQGITAGRALVGAYPTPENWRFALVSYRQLAAPQGGAEIDLYRLMRAAGAIAHPDEYQRYAQLLLSTGQTAEARSVLDEGVSRGIVDGTRAPIPDIRREIDRALQPPGRPAAPAEAAATRFRLAVSLALAGRRPEAETAFRAIAGGTDGAGRWYPDLAALWLLWLTRSG